MTKILIDEAVVRQALEALEDYEYGKETTAYLAKVERATAALRKALSDAALDALLDKMADNARELGLDYMEGSAERYEKELEQPAQQDIPDLIAGALGVSRGTAYDLMREALAEQPRSEAALAPAQERMAWVYDTGKGYKIVGYSSEAIAHLEHGTLLFPRTTPPALAQEPDPDELNIAYMSGLHEGKKIGAKEEREACAKEVTANAHMFATFQAAESLADTIRERGNT
jgi:hypothetical protein